MVIERKISVIKEERRNLKKIVKIETYSRLINNLFNYKWKKLLFIIKENKKYTSKRYTRILSVVNL